ncbi:MAG TPA: four helix bundle protein [Chitinophagales bacterium]|nr:four helix bundle protein [Chitinophagales bacterium]
MGIEELGVYNKALAFLNKIWEIIIPLSYFEKNTIGNQICRSADSISANIADGFGRYYYKDSKLFYYYARGSVFETKDWLHKLKDRNIINEITYTMLIDELNSIGKMLNNYIKSIGKLNQTTTNDQ